MELKRKSGSGKTRAQRGRDSKKNRQLKELLINAEGKANCFWCQDKLISGIDRLTVDHIIPLAIHQINEDENLVISCEHCNNLRGFVTDLYCKLKNKANMKRATLVYNVKKKYEELMCLKQIYKERQLWECLRELNYVLNAFYYRPSAMKKN